MRVKCIYNKGSELPSDLFFEGSSCKVSTEFPLIINKEYNVYAITINDGYAWYYVCDENFTYYPVWKPCPLFEIIDNSLSIYWVFAFSKKNENYYSRTIWAYAEWANELDYYENLFNGEKEEVKIFNKYKELMDLEFPDPSILDIAEKIDDEWVLCPFCIDAWQPNSKAGMVICPKCNRKLQNSLYKPN